MFKCEKCGELFENPLTIKEEVGEFGGVPAYQNFSVSPCCEESYVEVKKCKVCGEYSEDDYCEKCKNNVQKRFQTFINSEFSPEERELLNELYDGEWI